MSRRRISVKELGQPDHQGWLYRKKESKGFLGMKWKKYWFVLKKTSFYWYNNQQASKERLNVHALARGCDWSGWGRLLWVLQRAGDLQSPFLICAAV